VAVTLESTDLYSLSEVPRYLTVAAGSSEGELLGGAVPRLSSRGVAVYDAEAAEAAALLATRWEALC
jgi:hypothetical protein